MMDVRQRFIEGAFKHGWLVTDQNQLHGFGQNWDFEISKPNQTPIRVDVKAAKRISRDDHDVQYSWHWIELRISADEEGWLFDQKSNWIAFEVLDGFILVDRTRLVELIQDSVDLSKVVSSPRDAAYKVYSRACKTDAITLIGTDAINKIAVDHWQD